MQFLSLQTPIWLPCLTNVCEASSDLISHAGVQSLPSIHICKSLFLSVNVENNFALALERSHSQDSDGYQGRRPFRLMIWKTSFSLVYLALCLTWDVVFHVHFCWDQGCHHMAPNDGKPTLSLEMQLSQYCIALPRRNMPCISSVSFADFQIPACGVSHAFGC